MKKIVFILSFIFVAGISASTFANQATVNSDITISIVEDVDDKKPCKEDCAKDCCKDKAAKAENCSKKAETKCCTKSKASCDKKAEGDKKETTEKKKK